MNITYFDAITDPDITADSPEIAVKRFLVSQAIQLALAGVPGIYFSSLFGARNWLDGVEETGRHRTINRQKQDYDALSTALDKSDTLYSHVFNRMMTLLEKRSSSNAFNPLASQTVLEYGQSVFAVQRQSETDTVLALHNVTGDVVTLTLPDGNWKNLFDGAIHQASIKLDGYAAMWLKRQN